MKPFILLRVAAVIGLLYFVGHTLGAPWTPIRGPQELALLDAMRADSFKVMGESRTYLDFYRGFGYALSGFLLLQAVVLWQLATLAKADAVNVRPLMLTFFIFALVHATLVWKYFFWLPFSMAAAMAALLGLAFMGARLGASQVQDGIASQGG
jgi:hypothetical protein